MALVKLKRVLSRNRGIAEAIKGVEAIAGVPLSVMDSDGHALYGPALPEVGASPVLAGGEPVGWVSAGGNAGAAQTVATLLSAYAEDELEKKALARESLERYRELHILYEMGETLNAGLDLNTVIQRTLEEVRKLIDATSCSVMMIDESGQFLEAAGGMGGSQGGLQLRVGEGIAGCVAASGIPEIVNDVMKDPRFLNTESTLRSLICAPLKVKDKVFGVINLGNTTSVTYDSDDLKLFNAFVTQAAVAIENARLNEARMKQEVAKAKLQRYLSPHLVDMVMDDSLSTKLHSSRQNIAVFFSDIRNFTQLSEDLDPETLVNHLNEYFTDMVEIIFEHGGTLNKFVGDMIVALYGAPSQTDDNEARAIDTAIGMQRAIRDRQWSWITREFGVGVGINSADVVVGNIGSPQHMDYTAIGDGVNVASRLQAIALPGQIMVSRSVFDKTRGRYEFKRWGNVALKGKSKPVEVFEVLY